MRQSRYIRTWLARAWKATRVHTRVVLVRMSRLLSRRGATANAQLLLAAIPTIEYGWRTGVTTTSYHMKGEVLPTAIVYHGRKLHGAMPHSHCQDRCIAVFEHKDEDFEYGCLEARVVTLSRPEPEVARDLGIWWAIDYENGLLSEGRLLYGDAPSPRPASGSIANEDA